MENKTDLTSNGNSIFENIISWIFGTFSLAIGITNTFWGNDPQFGIFIILLSVIYFLPVELLIKKVAFFSVPNMFIIKIIIAVFIIWASLGVGELFDKIDMMLLDL